MHLFSLDIEYMRTNLKHVRSLRPVDGNEKLSKLNRLNKLRVMTILSRRGDSGKVISQLVLKFLSW